MRIDQSVIDNEYAQFQEVTDTALRNPEQFRLDAQRTLKAYTRRERKLLNAVATTLLPGRFFDAWQTDLQKKRAVLRTNESSKGFLNSLEKYLLLEQKEIPHVAYSLLHAQDEVLVERFIESLHLPDTRRGDATERTLVQLLKWSDEHLLSLQQHYASAAVYIAVSEQQHVTILDPIAGPFARSRARRGIRKERAQLAKNERKTLRSIDASLRQLRKNTLLTQLLDTHIEAVEFFGARAAYEKKLATLDTKDASQITVRAQLMRQESRHLKKTYHTMQHDMTFDALTMHDASFDELVRHLFTMSTIQKNRFMLAIKQYRELLHQRDDIIAAQDARKAAIDSLL